MGIKFSRKIFWSHKLYNSCLTHNQSGNRSDVCKVSHCDILSGNPIISVREVMLVDSEEDIVKLLDFVLTELCGKPIQDWLL